jgi:hypothetical protein
MHAMSFTELNVYVKVYDMNLAFSELNTSKQHSWRAEQEELTIMVTRSEN